MKIKLKAFESILQTPTGAMREIGGHNSGRLDKALEKSNLVPAICRIAGRLGLDMSTQDKTYTDAQTGLSFSAYRRPVTSNDIDYSDAVTIRHNGLPILNGCYSHIKSDEEHEHQYDFYGIDLPALQTHLPAIQALYDKATLMVPLQRSPNRAALQ